MKKFYLTLSKTFAAITFITLSVYPLLGQKLPVFKDHMITKDSLKKSPKISGELLELKSTSNKKFRTSDKGLPVKNKYIQISDGFVLVDITAKGNGDSLVTELSSLGMKNIAVYGRVVSGLLPIASIGQLAYVKNLKFARPGYKPITNIGAVTSQGDSAQRSSLARSKYNVSGKNLKIGVLSDSYNRTQGADSTILTGDLPGPGNPNGYNVPVEVIADTVKGEDEGRAMMEIIHDVAPAASLAFHTAYGGQANFANGIIHLAANKCNLIVDDVIYFFEPYFQDGIIAQAVDRVAKTGVGYFSAAGNQERASYESAFKPSGKEPLGPSYGVAHDFGNGDIYQQISLPAKSSILLILQWTDPSYSAGGKGAATDIDITLLNETADTILTASQEFNIGGDASEGFFYENTGPAAKFNILITKASGPSPKLIKYVEYDGYLTIDEFDTKSSTIIGHANAEGAIAVGAARYNRTPLYGVNPPKIESFSSAGGTPIFFDEAGDSIVPVDRHKPEIVAPNGGNTTFFYKGLDYEKDGWPNFFGTSAAAPHATGVAALIAETTGVTDKESLLHALKQSCIDMDDPSTPDFDLGFDYATGYGLIQADAAIEAALRGKEQVKYLFLLPVCSDAPEVERRWKIKNPNLFPVNVLATVYNSSEVKSIEALPGITYFTTKAVPGTFNFAFINWKNEEGCQQLIPGISLGDKCPLPGTARMEGSDENEMELSLIAYPNPVVDQLYFHLSTTGVNNSKVTLYNAQSISLFETEIVAGKNSGSIDLSAFPSGIYYLKAESGDSYNYTKIIK